ncbi:MAG: 16S rRNA (cytidine(1402)-2'-O)-methyltransferase [Clostridia bacterium]|nr:16S rRNA (cytidine(1402)-2'-O)-methyltransferase [Clostridia bacterium]
MEPATLYLVTTPIGNLADLSERGLKVLRECDFIAAEDTRNTRRLLAHFDIHKELVSYHEHNKAAKGDVLCDRIAAGESCALVTDAGMPGISDPGEDLVKKCAERKISVTAVPGPCAAVTALSLSALACGRFAFEGFLPQQSKEKKKRLEQIKGEVRTLIFYEAPHRLAQTLSDLAQTLGENRRISLCKELTKLNEDIARTTIGEAISALEITPARGEYVLIVEGLEEYQKRMPSPTSEVGETDFSALSPEEHVRLYEKRGLSHKDALKAAAADRGMTKSTFYRLLLDTKEE